MICRDLASCKLQNRLNSNTVVDVAEDNLESRYVLVVVYADTTNKVNITGGLKPNADMQPLVYFQIGDDCILQSSTGEMLPYTISYRFGYLLRRVSLLPEHSSMDSFVHSQIIMTALRVFRH
jgi:hypothetical protein